MEKTLEGIDPAAMAQMEAYDWPGNVRELENTMERSVALETGRLISLAVLPEKIRYGAQVANAGGESPKNGRPVIPDGGLDLEQYIQNTERAYLLAALEASGGVGTRAAELLKITYRSYRHYAKKYNIS
jgi:two-component system response regulator PilR (NtrC family)